MSERHQDPAEIRALALSRYNLVPEETYDEELERLIIAHYQLKQQMMHGPIDLDIAYPRLKRYEVEIGKRILVLSIAKLSTEQLIQTRSNLVESNRAMIPHAYLPEEYVQIKGADELIEIIDAELARRSES